jgi:zinc protease
MIKPMTELPVPPTSEFTLDNGLKVIVREDRRTSEVGLMLSYLTGPDLECPEDFGISRVLLDALLYEYDEDFLEEIGATYYSAGGDNFHRNQLLAPSNHLEFALKTLSTTMNAQLSDETLRYALDDNILRSKEKSSFVSAISYSPEFEALINMGSLYYRAPEALTANLERLPLEQIRRWHQTWYRPNNAVLVVVGDVQINEVKRLVEYCFGAHIRRDIPFRPFVHAPPAPGYRQMTQHLDTKYPLMLVAFNTPGVITTTGAESQRALRVLGSLLEGTVPTRLAIFGKNRSKLASTVAGSSPFSNQFKVAFHFEGDPSEAEADFWKLLEEVKRKPFSPEEIEPAITKQCTKVQQRLDTLEEQLSDISSLILSGQPWQLIDTKVAQLQSVTPEDVHRAANACLTRECASVAYVYPLAEKEPEVTKASE